LEPSRKASLHPPPRTIPLRIHASSTALGFTVPARAGPAYPPRRSSANLGLAQWSAGKCISARVHQSCNNHAHSPLCRVPRTSTGAPRSLQARVYRDSGPGQPAQGIRSRVLRPASGNGPPSQVHRPAPGRACNIHAHSPLRRVLRSSTGRPRSGVQVTSSGSLVPLWSGPPAQCNAHQSGFYAPARGRPAQSGSSATHRVGLQQLSLRCDGFYGPRPAGPAREPKLLARIHRAHSGPARLHK
jgi:hypothetical protein